MIVIPSCTRLHLLIPVCAFLLFPFFHARIYNQAKQITELLNSDFCRASTLAKIFNCPSIKPNFQFKMRFHIPAFRLKVAAVIHYAHDGVYAGLIYLGDPSWRLSRRHLPSNPLPPHQFHARFAPFAVGMCTPRPRSSSGESLCHVQWSTC